MSDRSAPHIVPLGVYDSPSAAVAAAIHHFRTLAEDGRARDSIIIIEGGIATEHIPSPDRWLTEVDGYVRLARRTGATMAVGYTEDRALVVVIVDPDGHLTTWSASRRGSTVGPWSVRPGDELDLVPVLSW